MRGRGARVGLSWGERDDQRDLVDVPVVAADAAAELRADDHALDVRDARSFLGKIEDREVGLSVLPALPLVECCRFRSLRPQSAG